MLSASVAGAASRLGGLRLTLGLFVLLALCVALSYLTSLVSSAWLALPLLLLALNLLAAVTSNPKFRQSPPLLSFHLALLGLLLLIALGQLTRLSGNAEVTSGERFAGELVSYEAGPLHRWRLDKVHFLLEGFSIEYAPGLQRGETRATIRWLAEDSGVQRGIIGDHLPLILQGYRFYTSHNKGYAPLVSWRSADDKSDTIALHLPSYPANEFSQIQQWQPRGGGVNMWLQLQFDEQIIDPEKSSRFHIPKEHKLVVRVNDERKEVVPGGSIEIAGGKLRYEELRTWMGFSVSSDWTLPWLFAAAFIAVLSMAWYYWVRFHRRPWQDG